MSKKTKDLPTNPTIEEIAEVSDTGEPQFEDVAIIEGEADLDPSNVDENAVDKAICEDCGAECAPEARGRQICWQCVEKETNGGQDTPATHPDTQPTGLRTIIDGKELGKSPITDEVLDLQERESPVSAKTKTTRPWITNVTRADDTGNVTIRFHDNTEIVKLGVSVEDYKTFEATFNEKDWQESSLAFLDGELAKYAEAM